MSDDNRDRIQLSFSPEVLALLRKLSAETSVPISRIVENTIKKMHKRKLDKPE